jgi:heme/copper-type cytochrome/quinol oxidase subunit 4
MHGKVHQFIVAAFALEIALTVMAFVLATVTIVAAFALEIALTVMAFA